MGVRWGNWPAVSATFDTRDTSDTSDTNDTNDTNTAGDTAITRRIACGRMHKHDRAYRPASTETRDQ